MLTQDLKPAPLIKIPINIKSDFYQAMIDTGASSCFMKYSLAQKLNLGIDFNKAKDIIPYGNNPMKTRGTTRTIIAIGGMSFERDFDLVDTMGL